ncbi:ATPase [Rhodococcus sp. 06-156-3C]|nr:MULTISPECIES: MoxR family ATPase [Rhodococcus]OZD05476.1 ATPase [Rhodococcus sp. 06-156-4C]OZD16588.1 ATPase [Rhodococcus sp. 06-156-4a]OZD26446.1 ATPase [Rhodococcus sp. 06-156-3C]OZD31842.1 ATPase [Rhodococcus sp. 06-156-3b]OZD35141.1 ATPase [Rhodococcus sp. 06-156-3]
MADMEERAREMSSGSGGLLVASRDGVSNGDASKADLSKGDGSNGGVSNVSASHGTEPKTTERNASVDAVNDLQQDVRILEKAVYEVKRVIVGQDRLVERILVGLLARGHVLLEGVPGVAKTLAVETFAKVVGGSFSRVQFTPDLVPTDLIGTRIYRQGREEFDTELGPVVANFVLADEINRAPAKVQSALLEVMAERHVSIGGKTFPMPDPFLVMATQNPIENEGVYPLPEAQRDRFLFKIVVDYPSVEEEREIVYRMGTAVPTPKQILDPAELVRLQKVASNVFVHHALVDYVVRVIAATRTPEQLGLDDVASWIAYGASPRATLGIISASRALALLRGRDYVVPQDVLEVIPDVLRHRLVLSYDALADEVTPEDVITRVLQTVGLPQVAPQAVGGGPQPTPPPVPNPQHSPNSQQPPFAQQPSFAQAPQPHQQQPHPHAGQFPAPGGQGPGPGNGAPQGQQVHQGQQGQQPVGNESTAGNQKQ